MSDLEERPLGNYGRSHALTCESKDQSNRGRAGSYTQRILPYAWPVHASDVPPLE